VPGEQKESSVFESLETRRLMAVTAAAFHSTLYVWGDEAANGISVGKSGDHLVVKEYQGIGHDGYVEIFRTLDSGVSAISIKGYADADTITIADAVTDRATVMGGSGADYLQAGGGETRLWGHGDWADDPSGEHAPLTDDGAADTTISGPGYSIHHGQNGNDYLYTDTNATSDYDMMNGGNGNDRFYVRGHGRMAYAFGNEGNDSFYPAQSATQQASFWGQGGFGDTLDYESWTVAVHIDTTGASWSGLRVGTRRHSIADGIDVVKGTNLNDSFVGGAGNDKFYGRDGNDTMDGNGGHDSLYGERGNDRLTGHAGNDYVWGGEGDDLMFGEGGDDRLYGEVGNDTMYGGVGSDTQVGGTGSDYIVSLDYVAGNDRVYCDNMDGTGGAGFFDTAMIDSDEFLIDAVSGAERVFL
jgi:Ca2+-binding RTX toxin-like protein